eukprot:scaffold814_cov100-Cylindrotheca_fusiformis.AAC.10
MTKAGNQASRAESSSDTNNTKYVSFDDECLSSIEEEMSLQKQAETSSARPFLVPRIIAIVVFMLSGASVAVGMQLVLTNENESLLESHFDDLADEISDETDKTFDHIHGLLTSISTSISSASMERDGTQWPTFFHEGFDAVGRVFLDSTATPLVSWSPIVEGAVETSNWESFSGSPIRTTSNSELLIPVWQMKSDSVDGTAINFDLLSHEVLKPSLDAVVASKGYSLSNFLDSVDTFGTYRTNAASGKERVPESVLAVPLFDELSSNNATVVGVVMVVIPWDRYFRDFFHEETGDIHIVLDDGSCGSEYTFLVSGPKVSFVGEGNLHNAKYTSSARTREFITGAHTVCSFFFTVYRAHELYLDEFDPISKIIPIIGLTIGFTIIFILYDVLLRKREERVVNVAERSNAIVAALFPAEFRDRLFGRGEKDMASASDSTAAPESSKFRLKSFLAREEQTAKANENVNADLAAPTLAGMESAMYDTRPIADLFPIATIMFADIAGFTAWSSVREPSQVFTLLETVYQSFDNIAKRKRVFKVETVGDCYVAVAGLPEARKDHAFTMAKFARECLLKFDELSKQLEVVLGPDTGDLAMRAGLHSGPVTAGVLRGDKSRFQLFGDTVNTAARIESTGMRNRVHLSSETAEFLIATGRSDWVQRRSDLVCVKGKGEIQTYWLCSPQDAVKEASRKKSIAPASSAASCSDGIALESLEKSLPPRILRLVKWNVEILKKLLKGVIAKQQGRPAHKKWSNQTEKRERELSKQKQCLREVTEIIALPQYDQRGYGDPSKVQVPIEAENELRHFVCMIASMHRDNHFHNFEHASHVTMSVSKLLSRIVAPEEVINGKHESDLGMSLHDHTYGITSDPLTQFSIVLAALIHDVDHSGVSNFQLIKENSKIASVFKQKSVAEQNSIVLAWDQLMSPKYSALRRCIYSNPSELDRFRQIIVNNVLATDLFDKELQSLRRNRWENAFQKNADPTRQTATWDDTNRKATIVMEHLIQASDVSHTMQHWHIYQKWNERLFAEMSVAYKNGRMEEDPAENWYQGELGFFDNYIIPLAKKLKDCGVFGVSCDEYLNYALENRREWANKGEEVVAKMVQQCEGRNSPAV